MPVSSETTRTVRSIVAGHGRLPVDVADLADDASLFEAGLTSHASVNLMLALELEFDLEFPDELLKRSTFESISSISQAVSRLQEEAA